MSTKPQRVLVIGWDGAAPELVYPWVEQGHLPALGRLMAGGATGEVASTMPPLSGPAWAAFVTGRTPGQTGMYDFLYRRKGSYGFAPINARMRDGRSLWKTLSDAGRRVGVFNVPLTHPVEPVNGYMVSGFMAPYGTRDYTYPPELADELDSLVGGYRLYPSASYSDRQPEAFFRAVEEVIEQRTQATLHLMDTRPWDFLITVMYETDTSEHQLWHYIDPTHPHYDPARVARYGNPLLRIFQQVDDSLRQILERVDDDTLVIFMSDHGMGPVHDFVFLNSWLRDEGFLALKQNAWTRMKSLAMYAGFNLVNVHKLVNALYLIKDIEHRVSYSKDSLLKRIFLSFDDVDWSRTVAYSFGRAVGPVYVNLRGREPQGIVEPGAEYEAVRDEIAHRALAFTDPRTGKRLAKAALRREEVYHGRHLEQAPDLILIPADETSHVFGLSDFGSWSLFEPAYRYTAVHRPNGVLAMRGPQVPAGQKIADARLEDLAPTILYAMGVPVPADMEGRVLTDVFDPAYVAAHPIVRGDGTGQRALDELTSGYNEDEEEQVTERLRQLGYMG